MSASADAILFYGYCWDEEIRLFDEEDGVDEWPEAILKRRGIVTPWMRYVEPEARGLWQAAEDAFRKENRKELVRYSEALADVEKEFGVELCWHCSEGCGMPYLCIPGTGAETSRGAPVDMTKLSLAIGPSWASRLDRWLAEMGVKKPQEHPQWWLVSRWV